MLLAHLRVVEVGPFADLAVPFDGGERPRLATVLVGGGGTGKTSLLAAIASTRPGHALPLGRPWVKPQGAPAFAVADWALGDDEEARPHPLRVASPNAQLDEREGEGALRRREQALFDRRAGEAGFVCVAISGARWFSRTPVMLSTPERTILRYDPRVAASFDDATRADLARETKQILSYAAVAAALTSDARPGAPARVLDAAVRGALEPVLALAGARYAGVDPVTLEPVFVSAGQERLPFDDLPTGVRHLVALVAVPLRALAGAYPAGDPRQGQGTALVDDADLHLDAAVQRGLVPALRQALPRVQWVLAAASPTVALGCDAGEVLALRRMHSSASVELYEGELAQTH
jgi:hypothetical protein